MKIQNTPIKKYSVIILLQHTSY